MRKKSLNVFLMFLLKTTYSKFVLKYQHISKFRRLFAFMKTNSFWGVKYCRSSCISGTHQNSKTSSISSSLEQRSIKGVKKRCSIKLKCNHTKPSPIDFISMVYDLALFQPDFLSLKKYRFKKTKIKFFKTNCIPNLSE